MREMVKDSFKYDKKKVAWFGIDSKLDYDWIME
jgi:hypothetical protein